MLFLWITSRILFWLHLILQPETNRPIQVKYPHCLHWKLWAWQIVTQMTKFCCYEDISVLVLTVSVSFHYSDVIMSAVASQITSLTIVYSTVYSGVDQRKHQSSASLAFVRWIHRWPVNSPHKGPVTRKMLPFDDVIMPVTVPLLLWCDWSQVSGRTRCPWELPLRSLLGLPSLSSLYTGKWR